MKTIHHLITSAAIGLLSLTSAFGASGTWTAGSSGTWNANGSWDGASFPGTAAAETATFNTNINVTANLTATLANSAIIQNRGTGNVVVTGSDFTINGAAGGGIIFGASDSTNVASGNIVFSNAIVLTSNVVVTQNELGDTAGILDIAGGIKASTARVLATSGRFDGVIRLSSLAETPANFRLAAGRNAGLAENSYIDFNVANFAFDRLQINRSTAADGYTILRAHDADRFVSSVSTIGAILQNQAAAGAEQTRIGFGGSYALTITNSASTPTFYTYNRNAFSTSIEFEQQNSATTTLHGRVLLSETGATTSGWGGINAVKLSGTGSGELIIVGAIEQGASDAPVASLVVDRGTSTTTTFAGTTANTYTGSTTVAEGTLKLNKTAGVNAIAGSVEVQAGGTLLIATNNQVANTSVVTLSGGTISRASGVSETFSNLNLTESSFLDFGSTESAGFFAFGTFNPTVSKTLTFLNFKADNYVTFSAASPLSMSYFAAGSGSLGLQGTWNGSDTFTITAIPEPSTIAAAAGLIGLLAGAGWRSRRRIQNV